MIPATENHDILADYNTSAASSGRERRDIWAYDLPLFASLQIQPFDLIDRGVFCVPASKEITYLFTEYAACVLAPRDVQRREGLPFIRTDLIQLTATRKILTTHATCSN